MAYIKPTKLTIVGQGLTQSASSTTGISAITISVNTATTSTLGIVKVGSGLSITTDGVLSATGGAGNGYTGSVGSTGTVGFTGSAGSTGTQGSVGFTGSVGYTGSRGDTGLGFVIAKSYSSVAALTADTSPTSIVAGQFAVIETGNVNDAENSRLYLWSGTAYSYVSDLSGAQGITGPQGNVGFTGSAGSTGGIGSTGTVGFTGSAGTGFTGSTGIGYTGSAGSTGTVGFTGSRGIDGVTTTTTVAAVTTIIGTTSTTAGIPGFSTKIYNGSLNDAYTLSNGDLYVWKGGDTAGSTATSIEYLIVAGGGAGAYGGGGGGGVLTTSGYVVSAGSPVSLSVGDGGVDANGGNSTFGSFTAIGGGRGGSSRASAGSSGGSGGGASFDYGNAAGGAGAGTTGQGYRGGYGSSGGGDASAGGGGGAGAVGTGGYANGTNLASGSTGAGGGAGGIGLLSSISGTSTYYGGGGGGGANVNGGNIGNAALGGLGGGGNGSTTSGGTTQAGTEGTANTGGGGGGGDPEVATSSFRRGGSGIVIIRYADTYPAASATTGSPTAVTTSGYRTYTWTTVGSGSITFATSAPTTGQGWVLVGNIKGIPGEYAAIGYTGSAGIGYTGSTGTQGNVGFTGSAGSTGTQGSAGFTGSAGIGFTGYSGSLGYTGSAGSIGFTGYSGSAGSTGPKITSVTVTDSSYNNLDDTAVALTGGYIKIGGSGFESGCQVLLGTTLATSVSYISSTEVRVQLPAASTGTYIIYLVNSDGGTAIRVNAVTFSPTPSWTTGAALSGSADTAISIQLAATDATSYALAAGSSLPSGITLSSGGLLSGTITGLSANTTYNFTIIATDAELQDSTRAFVFEITVGDTYFKYVSLLLAGNGTNLAQNNTFIDSSTNNFSITRAGNVSQGTFTPYGSNWSYFNNGASNYLNFGNQTALHLGSGDFTIEMWLWKNANTTYMTACGDFASASSNTFQILGNDDGTKLGVYSGASNSFVIMSVSSIPINTWTHVAFVRNSTTLTLYINGVSDVTATYSTNLNASTSFFIGHTPELNAGRYWNGYISNFRMVKGTAVYTGAFTPSTTPLTSISGTVLLTCQSNRFIDNSTNNFAITVSGSPSVQRFSPFSPTTAYSTIVIGGSAYCDGTSDFLQVSANSALNQSGDLTIEMWVYLNATPSVILTLYGFEITNYMKIGINTTRNLVVDQANVGPKVTSTNTIPLNAWAHIAFVRSGSSTNNCKIYINGTSQGQFTDTSNVTVTGTGIILAKVDSTTYSLNGYATDVRYSNAAIYTSAFTPPTAPLSAITSTKLLCNFTNGAIFDNAMMNDLETVGNAQISTSVKKYGTGSMYFDGTGDGLYRPSSDLYNFGVNNFTIEFWIYFNSKTGYQTIISSGYTPNTANGWIVQTGNGDGKIIFYKTTGGTTVVIATDTGSTVNTGQWYHIAIVRSASTTTIYRDGTSVGSGGDTNTYSASASLYIGGGSSVGFDNYFLNGYIDDLRITKGYARYTANFTPPTAALPTQ